VNGDGDVEGEEPGPVTPFHPADVPADLWIGVEWGRLVEADASSLAPLFPRSTCRAGLAGWLMAANRHRPPFPGRAAFG
jgi:hypothetical protein